MAGQVIQLTEVIAELRGLITGIENGMEEMRGKVRGLEATPPAGQQMPSDRRDDRDELMDRKFFNPSSFASGSVFREWKEEFEDFIAGRDPELAEKLERTEKAVEPIMSLGMNPKEVEVSKKLYRIFRKLIVEPEARSIVVHTPDKNPFEAWRLLTNKFNPKNDAFNAKTVRDIISTQVWMPKSMSELPMKIAEWEHKQIEHKRRTGDEVLTEALRKEMLLEMLSPELKTQVDAVSLIQEDDFFTYDKLKRFVQKWVFRMAPPGGVATRVGAKAAADALGSEDEPMDSFGKGPKRRESRRQEGCRQGRRPSRQGQSPVQLLPGVGPLRPRVPEHRHDQPEDGQDPGGRVRGQAHGEQGQGQGQVRRQGRQGQRL